MKLFTSIRISLITSLLVGSAAAQKMNTRAAERVAGNANERSSAYRFANVFDGTDAVVTVDNLTNIELRNIQGSNNRALERMNPRAIENAAWSPVFVGTGGNGLHYADFTVRLYANGTDDAEAPASFSTSFFGNNLSNDSNEFSIEFVQVTRASSMLSSEQIAAALGGDQPVSVWQFEGVTEYSIRFGWQGGNGPAEGKTFDTLMSSHSGDNVDGDNHLVLDARAAPLSSPSTVPEPSSSFLIVLSVFPLVFQRKRKEISSK